MSASGTPGPSPVTLTTRLIDRAGEAYVAGDFALQGLLVAAYDALGGTAECSPCAGTGSVMGDGGGDSRCGQCGGRGRTSAGLPQDAIARVLCAVPTTWLDPLLTGPEAIAGIEKCDGRVIETLLRAVKARVGAELAAAAPSPTPSEPAT